MNLFLIGCLVGAALGGAATVIVMALLQARRAEREYQRSRKSFGAEALHAMREQRSRDRARGAK